jgi:hypothetical protein
MLEKNPVWLAPVLWVALPAIATAAGAWWVNRNVTAAQAARDAQIQQQAELNVAQEYSSQIQSQILIERFTPVLWATVPAMIAVGGYFLWKANKEAARE